MFGQDESSTNRHIEKTFTVKNGGNLFLDTDVGDVDIVTWDKEEVLVKVDIEGSDRRSDKFDVKFAEGPTAFRSSGKPTTIVFSNGMSAI